MAKKNENIAEETVKKTTKKAKTEGEAVEKTEEEIAAEIAAKFDEDVYKRQVYRCFLLAAVREV